MLLAVHRVLKGQLQLKKFFKRQMNKSFFDLSRRGNLDKGRFREKLVNGNENCLLNQKHPDTRLLSQKLILRYNK